MFSEYTEVLMLISIITVFSVIMSFTLMWLLFYKPEVNIY